MAPGKHEFDAVRQTAVIRKLIERGQLVDESVVERSILGGDDEGVEHVIEHPRLPFVSHPYEWPFSLLQKAALLHLDVHLEALKHGVTLSDASSYNVQFQGVRPIFIDHLSFRMYREGEFWLGHRQFCEQFLNPLLLTSKTGIPFNGWYRGEMEGLSAQSLRRVLPLRSKLSPNVLMHVVLQAGMQNQQRSRDKAQDVISKRKLSRPAFERILTGLRRWIANLAPAGGKTTWEDYADNTSYDVGETQAKHRFIADFSATVQPAMLWDLGCNSGEFSKTAIDSGAQYVVGFDFDCGALEAACTRAQDQELPLLPLFLDAVNPAPDQGWAQKERAGLSRRAEASGMLALALVHHLAIARNVPLPDVITWLVSLAPQGVIEFVPKGDPMVQALLHLREDIFQDYNQAVFEVALAKLADIVRSEQVSKSGRTLFWYQRRS